MLFQEGKEAYRQGKERYLSQYWNLVTLIMLALFVVSGVLWFIGHLMIVSGVKEASAKKLDYRSILLSNAFFAFGMVLAFFHISNSFQVNSMLGPLQLSLVKMVRDIAKFLFLFLLLFLAFAWAERKVYSSYVHARTKFVANTTHKFAKWVFIAFRDAIMSYWGYTIHYYFCGARSKGFVTLRDVPKLLFSDKIGQAKSVGFRCYSAVWRTESWISSRYLDHLDITSSSHLFEEEIIINPGLPRVWTGSRVSRQIRWDPKLRD